MHLQNTLVSPKSEYYSHLRLPLLNLAEGNPKRVLEIGCGHGQSLIYFKRHRAAEIAVGIEYVPQVAAIARQHSELDCVVVGDIEDLELDFPEGYFDLVIAGHVLEHVKDPWSVTRHLRRLLQPKGQFIGSLPNVRNVKVLLPLLFMGKWEYQSEGVLDWTHTKFFAKSTIFHLLTSSGFTPDCIEPEFAPKSGLLNLATAGLFRNVLSYTYNFSARPADKLYDTA